MDLGPVGIWSGEFRNDDEADARDAAAELDELGYGALWIPGGAGGPILEVCERALAATTRLTLAPGILNIWMHDAADVAAGHHRLVERFPGRFLLGLGISHSMLIDSGGEKRYTHPLAVMADYLDQLDAAATPVPAEERIIAALGPKMLALAGARSAGSHPYYVTPDHTAYARGILGAGPLLAPEQKVILDTDKARARELARANASLYLRLPNYVNNLRRIGFTDDDFADQGSDRLVDAIVVSGDLDAIANRVREHLDAGADHVCVQVVNPDRQAFPRQQWREIATMLPSFAS
jgi:probable F420-dependent oxidoreductase